jgi:hypothetical protein
MKPSITIPAVEVLHEIRQKRIKGDFQSIEFDIKSGTQVYVFLKGDDKKNEKDLLIELDAGASLKESPRDVQKPPTGPSSPDVKTVVYNRLRQPSTDYRRISESPSVYSTIMVTDKKDWSAIETIEMDYDTFRYYVKAKVPKSLREEIKKKDVYIYMENLIDTKFRKDHLLIRIPKVAKELNAPDSKDFTTRMCEIPKGHEFKCSDYDGGKNAVCFSTTTTRPRMMVPTHRMYYVTFVDEIRNYDKDVREIRQCIKDKIQVYVFMKGAKDGKKDMLIHLTPTEESAF